MSTDAGVRMLRRSAITTSSRSLSSFQARTGLQGSSVRATGGGVHGLVPSHGLPSFGWPDYRRGAYQPPGAVGRIPIKLGEERGCSSTWPAADVVFPDGSEWNIRCQGNREMVETVTRYEEAACPVRACFSLGCFHSGIQFFVHLGPAFSAEVSDNEHFSVQFSSVHSGCRSSSISGVALSH